ncbi:MAG: hypothetical protein ACQESG_00855 [Nanobdellota archaeon]
MVKQSLSKFVGTHIILPLTVLFGADTYAMNVDESARIPEREYQVSRHYEEPTYGVDVMAHVGGKTGVEAKATRKLYRSVDKSFEADVTGEVGYESFELDTSAGNHEYDLTKAQVGVDGIHKRELDGEWGKVFRYYTLEPSLDLMMLGSSVDYGDDSVRETSLFLTPGLFANLFVDREEIGLVGNDGLTYNKPEFGTLIRYLQFGLGIEKQFSLNSPNYPDDVPELQEIENDPLTLRTAFGFDDMLRLEYMHAFGRYADHNEAWFKYFPRGQVNGINTLNSLGLGYDDDYGKRDILTLALTSYFLRPEILHEPEYQKMDVGYLFGLDARIDSEGGGKLFGRVPLTDGMVKGFFFSEQLGLADENGINHQNQLEFILGFQRDTYVDADPLHSLYFGLGWDYKVPLKVGTLDVTERDRNE